VSQCIASGTLTSTKGSFVKTLEEQFARRVGTSRAFACSSGSSAIHTAVAAIDPEPGDEIITTGGIYGTITNVKDDRFVVRIAENTKVELGKAFIQAVVKRQGEEKK